MSLSKALVLAAVAALFAPAAALAGPPPVQARAFVVEDGETGEILAQHNARERLPIASITKLMTVLLTLEHVRPTEIATVPPQVTTVGESTIFLRAGERISVLDLIEGALIPSANDAADTLAYHVGKGNEGRFVAMMNSRARRLGLRDTRYVRPDGLDAPGEFSSARDVTKLARVLMRRPLVRRIVRRTGATIAGGRKVVTRNQLLYTYPGLIGVKTGHTSLAGWSEVAAARRNAATIYATILGAPSESQRDADLAALLTWGLEQYRPATLVAAHRAYAHVATAYGRGEVNLVPARPLVHSVRVGRPLVERVVVPTATDLPITRGERLGQVRIYAGEHLIGTTPLVAARSVSRPGLGARLVWYVGRAFHHLWSWIP